MIPIKDKVYEIDFYDISEPNLSYRGVGTYVGESGEVDSIGNILYLFKLPNNTCHAYFSEEDIIRACTE